MPPKNRPRRSHAGTQHHVDREAVERTCCPVCHRSHDAFMLRDAIVGSASAPFGSAGLHAGRQNGRQTHSSVICLLPFIAGLAKIVSTKESLRSRPFTKENAADWQMREIPRAGCSTPDGIACTLPARRAKAFGRNSTPKYVLLYSDSMPNFAEGRNPQL